MHAFLLVNGILLFLILILLFLLSGIWPPDSPWAPWWQMPPEIIRRMCKLAKVNKKSVIYDLGSGTGRALIIAAKEFGIKGIGIEIDPLRYYISQFNHWRYHTGGNVTFLKKNFFAVPLTKATVLFIYLIPNALKRLVPKFMKELQSGTVIASYKYALPVEMFKGKLKLIEEDKSMGIFVYSVE